MDQIPHSEFSRLTLMLFAAIGLMALIGVKTLLQSRSRTKWLAILAVIAVPLVVRSLFSAHTRHHHGVTIVDASPSNRVATVLGAAAVDGRAPQYQHERLLDELWDQLHSVRIDLSKEPAPESDDETAKPAKKQADRPAWVDRPAKRVGNVYQQKLTAGPWQYEEDCHRELEAKMRVAVERRIEQLAGKLVGKRDVDVPPLEAMGLGMDDVLRDLCTERFVETVESESFEDMKNVHVLMEFTAAEDARLVDGWRDYQRGSRLTVVSIGAGFVLGALALAYGLLCVDTWTRGYYTKRLLVGVPAAILAVVALLVA